MDKMTVEQWFDDIHDRLVHYPVLDRGFVDLPFFWIKNSEWLIRRMTICTRQDLITKGEQVVF